MAGGGVGYAMETERRCAGCTLTVNPLPFVTAIVASNPGDLVRGAFGACNTCASRFLETSLSVRRIREAVLVQELSQAQWRFVKT